MQLQVGKPWPYGRAPDGMQAVLSPADEAFSLMLVCHVAKPTAGEFKAFRSKPIRVGLWSSPPLTWFLLDVGELSMDAPYACGIASPEHAVSVRVNVLAAKPRRLGRGYKASAARRLSLLVR